MCMVGDVLSNVSVLYYNVTFRLKAHTVGRNSNCSNCANQNICNCVTNLHDNVKLIAFQSLLKWLAMTLKCTFSYINKIMLIQYLISIITSVFNSIEKLIQHYKLLSVFFLDMSTNCPIQETNHFQKRSPSTVREKRKEVVALKDE